MFPSPKFHFTEEGRGLVESPKLIVVPRQAEVEEAVKATFDPFRTETVEEAVLEQPLEELAVSVTV